MSNENIDYQQILLKGMNKQWLVNFELLEENSLLVKELISLHQVLYQSFIGNELPAIKNFS